MNFCFIFAEVFKNKEMDNNFCEFDIDKLIGNIEVSGKSIASLLRIGPRLPLLLLPEYGENGRGYFTKLHQCILIFH